MRFEFDELGWLLNHQSDVEVVQVPIKRFWAGMHPSIQKDYNNCLQGTITHYDALYSAYRAVKGFSRKTSGPSTHFVISRGGKLIYQLVSINNRAWHAALKKGVDYQEGEPGFQMANGVFTRNPNHWFVGIDFSNLGPLKFVKNKGYISHIDTHVSTADVFTDSDGKFWERYTDEAKELYVNLISAISLHNNIPKEMHYRHSDVSPKRKLDPGPALNFHELIDAAYESRWSDSKAAKSLEKIIDSFFGSIERIGDPDSL